MKKLLAIFFILYSSVLFAQNDSLLSRVYSWKELSVQKDSSRDRRQVLEGKTHCLLYMEVHTSTLEPGKAPHPPHVHNDMEELIIVKEGKLKVNIKGQIKIFNAGSVAFAQPGDEHGFENGGDTKVTYYILKFKSRSAMDIARGNKAGGSFVVDWDTLALRKTDKGARRNLFDHPTSLLSRCEMHVTTLNEGEISHAPHTHAAEEIILLRQGNVQMQIADKFYNAGPGDLVFLSSNIPHALKNTGKGQCEYYAFQWKD
jgi:(S)-ureidoglycine aminohydrolase